MSIMNGALLGSWSYKMRSLVLPRFGQVLKISNTKPDLCFQDLNLPQVQRCKGLTHDLLTLILSHRIQLMKALRDYKKLM